MQVEMALVSILEAFKKYLTRHTSGRLTAAAEFGRYV